MALDARKIIGWVGVSASLGCGVSVDAGLSGGAETSGFEPSATTAGVVPSNASDSDSEPDTDGDEPGQAGGSCLEDVRCADNEFCAADGRCVQPCSENEPCGGGLSCCGDRCVDLVRDANHCGECDSACEAGSGCSAGACTVVECPDGFSDCNGNAADGCEVFGACICSPGATERCYTGPEGTEGVGPCAGGSRTCGASGMQWGPCEGEVVPVPEVCSNGIDDDCSGAVDEDDVDADEDGWRVCERDCCDSVGVGGCADPVLVNPGALDVAGNSVDDDCDGFVDNAEASCDASLVSNSPDALDYARALELCRFTEASPPRSELTWGVIAADLLLASDDGVADSRSRALRDGFGSGVQNEFGDRLVVLSTGHAADNYDDVLPPYAAFESGVEVGSESEYPAQWLAANGGTVPNAPGCEGPYDEVANDSVNLRLRIRAPTNANSFSVKMFFFSSEYPEYVCTAYNDFFIALVDSEDVANPADGNIAIYEDEGGLTWPVGVNLVSAAAGLFEACDPDADVDVCDEGGASAAGTCTNPAAVAGTGFDVTSDCGPTGGGTGWLRMTGNIEPGEVFEIRFIIWDASDSIYDSLVLLDHWQWSTQASQPGIAPG